MTQQFPGFFCQLCDFSLNSFLRLHANKEQVHLIEFRIPPKKKVLKRLLTYPALKASCFQNH